MTVMQIWLNDQPLTCEPEQTLSQLLAQLSLPVQGTAVAINQQIIAASDWSTTTLSEGDQIALFQAIAGG